MAVTRAFNRQRRVRIVPSAPRERRVIFQYSQLNNARHVLRAQIAVVANGFSVQFILSHCLCMLVRCRMSRSGILFTLLSIYSHPAPKHIN